MLFERRKINIKLKDSLYKIETKILLSEDNLFSRNDFFFFFAYEVFAWNSNKDDFFQSLNILLVKFSQLESVMLMCIFIMYSNGKNYP